MNKLRDKRGETLVETLTALLVATLVLLFLSTAVAVAMRVNKQVRDADTSFRYSREIATNADFFDVTVTDERTGQDVDQIHVYQYKDESGQYLYYKGVSGDE